MVESDLIIRDGTLADGRGGPLYESDVAIKDGVIVAVGKDLGRARQEIDAKGLLVTPGFVDIHTHYDGQAIWDTQLAPSSWHGVTTAVMGNCGVGFAPVKPEHREVLIELMEGVEDIPGSALHEGLKWSWETFPQYLDALERQPRDMDICAQLPHGSLRVFVMGDRAVRLEPSTPADNEQMRHLCADAMRAGAIGFSTTRSLNHRTVRGDPTPSLRASADELVAIAMGMRDAGSGVMELISDWNPEEFDAEWAMVRRIVESSGRPLSFSLLPRHAPNDPWRHLLALTEQAQRDGLPIRAQVAPRPIGVLLGLQGSRNPFIYYPTYREIAGRPLDERVAIMRDPQFRQRLLADAASDSNPMGVRLRAWDRMFPFSDPPNYEPPQESSIASQAAREGRTPQEIAYDMLLRDDGRAFIFAPFANYYDYNLDNCHELLKNEHTLVGLGDGGAHVSVISDGSFPTYLLQHWGRDRATGRLDIGRLVRKQTRDNARAVGLTDRGEIAVGQKADLNVIDFDRLAVGQPRMVADLPAGGNRLLQRADGYVATIVSGIVTYRDGEATGALPGKLVRAGAAGEAARRGPDRGQARAAA